MKHFFIIANLRKDKDLALTKQMKIYIEEHGGSCAYFASEGKKGLDLALNPEKIPNETECILVLGGDGTLIRAASQLVQCQIPLVGVNLGTLGYLCELEAKDVFTSLDRLMQDSYIVEERMLLTGHAQMSDGAYTTERIALNEVTIHRASTLSILNLNVYVNGAYLYTFRGDGMLVSTPTGSTGYNMSAGGPIVDPKAKILLLTTINAHNINAKSIVISAEDEVMIELASRNPERNETALVSFDGDSVTQLAVGDKFVVKQADSSIKICRLSEESFLEILRKKMQAYT